MTCLATYYLLAKLAWLHPAVPRTGHLLGPEKPELCFVLPDQNWHKVDNLDQVQQHCVRPNPFSSIRYVNLSIGKSQLLLLLLLARFQESNALL